MKPRSSIAVQKAVLVSSGSLALSLVWLAGSLADKPVMAADGSDHPSLMGPRALPAEKPVVSGTLPERQVMAAEDAEDAGPHANPVFARNVAGTYAEVVPDLYSLTMNIRADGTLMWFGSWFFGAGTGDFYDGPVIGSWKQTGDLELTTIEMGYLFNGDGSFFATGRVTEVLTFSPDFESISYSFEEELFAPDQDPTDPDAVAFDSFGGSGCCIVRLNHMD